MEHIVGAFLYSSGGTIPRLARHECAAIRGCVVVGRNYFTWRAASLLKLAKSISDPHLAGALVEKAADLKARLDQANPPDQSLRAPDVEFPERPSS